MRRRPVAAISGTPSSRSRSSAARVPACIVNVLDADVGSGHSVPSRSVTISSIEAMAYLHVAGHERQNARRNAAPTRGRTERAAAPQYGPSMAEAMGERRTALVTGGSRGIGAEIARQLCDAGYGVVITGRDADRLAEAAEGIGAIPVVSDAAEPGAPARAVSKVIEHFGHLDLLVNNAGTGGPGGPLLYRSVDDWWDVLRTNLYGPMAFMHEALPGMVERGSGLVINIGSYGAVRPVPGNSPYSTSKAALARLTDSVAAELAGTGVVVLCVSPGLVDTDMTRRAGVFDDVPAEAWDPIQRIGKLVRALADRRDVVRLSGRFLHVRDDLDEILEHIDEIERDGLYQLGLSRLEGRVG